MKRGSIITTAIVLCLSLFACGNNDEGYDVIVVGSGLAGHSAAYAAASEGADVLWIEKEDKLGGAALWATGTYCAPGTEIQKNQGIEDSPELMIEDINRIGKNKADQALLKLFAEKSTEVWEWFMANGLVPSDKGAVIDPVHSPYSVPRTMTPAKNSANEYNKVLKARMDEAEGDVTVLLATRAIALITEEGAVTGVKTESENGTANHHAKAVILATGGYGSNPEIITEYMPKYERMVTITPPHATGDGLLMAKAAGAALVNMDYQVPYFGGMRSSEESRNVTFFDLTSGFADRWIGDIWVDQTGKRFINEDHYDEDPRETALNQVPDTEAFILFDQGMVEANGGIIPIRKWDERLDNGYSVKKADSLEELAASFDLPVQAVMATVDQVNADAGAGAVDAFGKETVHALDTPPYYGVRSYGVIFMTQGGIKTNDKLEVLSEDGEVIPGLYAAGEVMGTTQWGGHGLSGGTGNAPPLVFGREAGRNAARKALLK